MQTLICVDCFALSAPTLPDRCAAAIEAGRISPPQNQTLMASGKSHRAHIHILCHKTPPGTTPKIAISLRNCHPAVTALRQLNPPNRLFLHLFVALGPGATLWKPPMALYWGAGVSTTSVASSKPMRIRPSSNAISSGAPARLMSRSMTSLQLVAVCSRRANTPCCSPGIDA